MIPSDTNTDTSNTDTDPAQTATPVSPLDLMAFDIATPAEHGTDVVLENPYTGGPLIGSDGLPVTWTLLGEDSKRVRAIIAEQQDKKNNDTNRGKGFTLSIAQIEANQIEKLLAATVRYSANFTAGDHVIQPYTAGHARYLLNEPKLRWIPEQLVQALGDRKRFLLKASTI